jgi:flagellar hook assembly protein FlgD
LVRDTDVAIKIHTPSGQLVRTLELGDKLAGLYTERTKAAHWDGTNESGEAVASGVYFYTIQTDDDYTATKKMVIAR